MTQRSSAPGVYISETDQSFIAPTEIQKGLAVVGPTEKGQAFIPTNINTFAQYNGIFGLDTGNSYVPQTVYNYLQAGDNVKVIRVLGNGGWSYSSTKKLAAIVTGSKILTVLHPSQNAYPALASLNSSTVATGSYALFNLTVSGSQVYQQVSSSLNPSSAYYVSKVLGTDAKFQTGSAFPYLNFSNYYTGSVTASAQVNMALSSTAITFTSSYAEGYDAASTPWVTSTAGNKLFKFVHKSHGFKTNTDVKVCIANITVNSSATVYTKFDVVVRAWNDTEKTPSILEQFIGVTLDVNASNYIGKVIGDKYQQYDTLTGKVIEYGDYPNISNYVRIVLDGSIVNDSINPNIAPNGHQAVYEPIAGFTGFTLPSASFVFSTTSSAAYSGFDYYNSDNANYLNPIPLEAGVGANAAFTVPSNDNKFVLPFQGGTDGMSYSTIKNIGANISSDGTNVFGFDLSTSTSSGTSAYTKALDILSNKEAYGFDIMTMPGVIEQYHSTVTAYAQAMVESRANVVYLRDLTGVNETVATAVSTAAGLDSSYSAAYYPWIKVKDLAGGNDKYVPPTVMVPQAVAYTDKIAAPWFAVAGTGNGQLGGAIDVKNRLKQSEVGTLYDANINSIIKKTTTGVVIWGQKTLQAKTSALSHLNVRRLQIEIEGYIGALSDDLLFQPNTEALKTKFKNLVNPYLKGIQQKEGLVAWQIVMDDTNNSNSDIDNGILRGYILIQPTIAVEYIYLDFQIQKSGVIFGQ